MIEYVLISWMWLNGMFMARRNVDEMFHGDARRYPFYEIGLVVFWPILLPMILLAGWWLVVVEGVQKMHAKRRSNRRG